MAVAECLSLDGSEFRMAAPPAFGNVVEKRCDIKQPRAVKTTDQLAAIGVFVTEFCFGKTSQVA